MLGQFPSHFYLSTKTIVICLIVPRYISGTLKTPMKHCKVFFRIVTEFVAVPEHLQRDTHLPGDPIGNQRTGFSEFRRELLTMAMLDRAKGGHPVITKISTS